MKWKIKHEKNGHAEWWIVTDGKHRFLCEIKEDADWLAGFLSARSVGQDKPEKQKVQSSA